jgi:hypothetical protein
MIETASNLLSTLHRELSGIGGYLVVAPKTATYPLLTYTILNSSPTRVKTFTSDGNIYSVQFSYFSDKTLTDCLSLATSAETKINSLSAFLDVSNARINIIGNTEQHNYYQLNDTRDIEIVKDI